MSITDKLLEQSPVVLNYTVQGKGKEKLEQIIKECATPNVSLLEIARFGFLLGVKYANKNGKF